MTEHEDRDDLPDRWWSVLVFVLVGLLGLGGFGSTLWTMLSWFR